MKLDNFSAVKYEFADAIMVIDIWMTGEEMRGDMRTQEERKRKKWTREERRGTILL